MRTLKAIEERGEADVGQWSDTKLYNVKYTNPEGKLIDLGDFKTLNQAQKVANRYQTGEDSAKPKK
ncbi:MAG: hypothetical protein ACYTFM_09690 [Planctomycetota bacterium]|jgi:hypothetical protein